MAVGLRHDDDDVGWTDKFGCRLDVFEQCDYIDLVFEFLTDFGRIDLQTKGFVVKALLVLYA